MFKYFSLDVQIIATGSSCSMRDRAIGAVCLMNEKGDIEYFALIKHNKPVSSFFERKTGLSKNYTQYGGIPFEDARKRLRGRLGPDSVLVSHNSKKIPHMMGLRQGKDYHHTIELEDWFKYKSEAVECTFSLEHALYWLLDIDILTGVNSPFDRAIYTMCLFDEYQNRDLKEAQEKCYKNRTGTVPAFEVIHPVFEGVCQGHIHQAIKKGVSCACGYRNSVNNSEKL